MHIDRDDWRTWCPTLAPWLEAQLSEVALEGFHAGVEPTWLEWLDERTAPHAERPLIGNFEIFLKQKFDGIRVVHATRLADLRDLRQFGLRAWSPDELRHAAQNAYGDQTDTRSLRCAIEQNAPEHRGGRVYTFPSLSHALSTYGGSRTGRLPSFALSGGEFLGSVGAMLALADHPLRNQRAYFIACNLPWTSIPENTLELLISDLLSTLLIWRFLAPDDYRMEGSVECINTEQDIPPKQIVAISNVEPLRMRNDLAPSDIAWESVL